MHGVCILHAVAVCHQILSFAPLTLKQLNEHNNCYSIQYNDSVIFRPIQILNRVSHTRAYTSISISIAVPLKYSVDLMNLAIFIINSAFRRTYFCHAFVQSVLVSAFQLAQHNGYSIFDCFNLLYIGSISILNSINPH